VSPRKKKDSAKPAPVSAEAVGTESLAADGAEEVVVVARGRTIPLLPAEEAKPVVESPDPVEVDSQVQEESPVSEMADSPAEDLGSQEGEQSDQVEQESSEDTAGDILEAEHAQDENYAVAGVSDSDVEDGTGDPPQEKVSDAKRALNEGDNPVEDVTDSVDDEAKAQAPANETSQDFELQPVTEQVAPDFVGPTGRQAPAERQLQQIDSTLGRFKKWLGGSTTVGRPLAKATEDTAVVVVDAGQQNPQQAEAETLSPAAAKKELRTLKSSQRSWDTLIVDREQKASQIRETIEENEQKIGALTEWVTNFDRSYQWRLQQRMDQQLQRAEAELRAYEDSVRNVEEFEPGRLSELRRSFHRLLRQIFAVTLPIAIVTIAIPISFRIPKLDALETFYDPRLSAPVITLVVLAVIAAIFLFRRATGKDTVQNITIVRWILLTLSVGLIIVILPVFEDDMRNVLSPYLEENQTRILSVLGFIILLWLVLALAIYYRGWSQYRRAIDTQLAKLQAVISGYVETQQEVNRLSLLYKQTSEWLRILAFSLYRPWVTPAEWEEEKHSESEFRDFPFALRVAQVDDQAGAKSAELERIIGSKLLVQGWRANAFRDLVEEVRKDMGVAAGKFSVDALDKDLPHQTNNTRNLLKNYLESAADDVDKGEGADSSSTGFLVEVARTRLLDLIEQTQSVALSAARPPVNQIISDPLDELVNDATLLQGDDESENWDGFLKESLGTEEIIQPPLSILNFTPDGQMNKVGEDPKTFVLIPQRLADALPHVAESVNLVPVTDNSSRAVEIIARVDVVGPITQGDIRLFSQGKQKVSAMSREQKDPGAKVAALCQNCFDPTCPASLDAKAACSGGGL
jgi:hypothetical protein